MGNNKWTQLNIKHVADFGKDKRYTVDADDSAMPRPIDWQGPGWYSLDNNGIYHIGEFPTCSRIKITRK